MLNRSTNNRGFTLIELTLTVLIVSILAALGIPRFMSTTGAAKQTEAKGILKQIYTMEMTYFEEHSNYTNDINSLDVEFMPNTRYDYAIELDGNNFIATATADDPGIDDDASPDIWKVDNTGFIVSVTDDTKE